MIASDAFAVGATIERPIMEDGELAVSGWLDIKFDHIGFEPKRLAHGSNRVFEILMFWWINTCSCAGIVGDALRVKRLCHPPMSQQKWLAAMPCEKKRTIIEVYVDYQ